MNQPYSIFNSKNPLFSREEAFRYYFIELGEARSIAKVCKWLESRGIVNPKTGRRITDMGVWGGMWRWAARNIDKSLAIANEGFKDSGQYFDRDRWIEHINHRNRLTLTRKGAEKWKKANLSEQTTPA